MRRTFRDQTRLRAVAVVGMVLPILALVWVGLIMSRGGVPAAVLVLQAIVVSAAGIPVGIYMARRARRLGLYIDDEKVVIENWRSRTETARGQVAEVVAGRVMFPAWPKPVVVFLVLKDGRRLRVDALGAFNHLERLAAVLNEIEATLGLTADRPSEAASWRTFP